MSTKAKKECWLGKATISLINEGLVITTEKTSLLKWIIDNEKTIPSSYRAISQKSAISYAVVALTFKKLQKLNFIAKEGHKSGKGYEIIY